MLKGDSGQRVISSLLILMEEFRSRIGDQHLRLDEWMGRSDESEISHLFWSLLHRCSASAESVSSSFL